MINRHIICTPISPGKNPCSQSIVFAKTIGRPAVSMFLALMLALVISSVTTFGQKFMIHDNDTLPYKETMKVLTDTLHLGGKTYLPGDTLFEGACSTFEKINGQIINQSDGMCLRQGDWVLTDSLGNYWKGAYQDNYEVGIWKRFDKNGKLLKETEKIYLGKNIYTVKEIEYSGGTRRVIVDKPLFAFCVNFFVVIWIIVVVLFFVRAFINSRIYNRENGTDHSFFHFGLPFTQKYWVALSHGILCFFTFWFFNYKKENRQLVIVSSVLSTIVLGAFFGLIVILVRH